MNNYVVQGKKSRIENMTFYRQKHKNKYFMDNYKPVRINW